MGSGTSMCCDGDDAGDHEEDLSDAFNRLSLSSKLDLSPTVYCNEDYVNANEMRLSKLARAAGRMELPSDLLPMHDGRERHRAVARYGKEHFYEGLKFEDHHNINGARARFDVFDEANKTIYDFKFGKTATVPGCSGMSKAQYTKYHNMYPDYEIKTINRMGDITTVNEDNLLEAIDI